MAGLGETTEFDTMNAISIPGFLQAFMRAYASCVIDAAAVMNLFPYSVKNGAAVALTECLSLESKSSPFGCKGGVKPVL